MPLSRLSEPNTLVADTSDRYDCCDVQDGIFTFNVYAHHEKPWVEQLMIPYLVFFGVACVVSLFTLGQKGKLLVDKFRQRNAASSAGEESVETLEEKLIANRMEIRKIYCVLLLGAAEGALCNFLMFDAKTKSCSLSHPFVHECASGCAGWPVRSSTFARRLTLTSWRPSAVFTRLPCCSDLPMSALSLYYLVRSVDECIHSADAHRKPSNELVVCGLTEGPANLVNVLSAVTSAAMLM